MFEKFRNWSVTFQCLQKFETLPRPHQIVLETQDTPSYRWQGRGRPLDEAQIVLTLEGEGFFRYGTEKYRLTPGKVFLSVTGDPMTAYGYPKHGKVPWRFLWISFQGKVATAMVTELAKVYGHVVTLCEESSFAKLLQSYRLPRQHFIRFVSALDAAKVCLDVFAALGESLVTTHGISRKQQLVGIARESVQLTIHQPLSLGDIAAKLHISREHLSRVFHEQTGETLAAYALRTKMELAASLLRYQLLSCQEVAERTGFVNASSFARAFRHYYHISPSHYRKSEYSSLSPETPPKKAMT